MNPQDMSHSFFQHVSHVLPTFSIFTRGVWAREHEDAFSRLKKNFLSAVTLQHYLPNVEFRLQTDASDVGISGVLYQIDDAGDHRIVSLTSRLLRY